MSTVPKPYITPERYLEIERKVECRSEYYAGEMFAMSGGTDSHNLIGVNLAGVLRNQLLDRNCRNFSSDMRILVSESGLYTYADASIVCGTPLFLDTHRDTLLNPQVVVEVLSPSTERYDRGKKFELYRNLESLKHYVLVSQDHMMIECFSRDSDGRWALTDASEPDEIMRLDAVDCELRVADVYSKVEFQPESGADATSN